jgi:hypothetical protein
MGKSGGGGRTDHRLIGVRLDGAKDRHGRT